MRCKKKTFLFRGKGKEKKLFRFIFFEARKWKLLKVFFRQKFRNINFIRIQANWIMFFFSSFVRYKSKLKGLQKMPARTKKNIRSLRKCIYGWDFISFMIYLYSECANKTLYSFCHWMGLKLMQTHSGVEFKGNKALFSDCKYLINKNTHIACSWAIVYGSWI